MIYRQAQAILDLRLQKLTGLEQDKIVTEYEELLETIRNLLDILANPDRLMSVISAELDDVNQQYGDERRTEIVQSKQDLKTSLELYVNSDDEVVLITPTVIKKHMRMVASHVYGLVLSRMLRSSRSGAICVGACVLLHSLGYSETQLKWLLRWKSDAFMAYLRNLAGLADKQSQALNTAAGMPNFF